MDADPLSLLIILRQELKDIANHLQPQPEVTEAIMTDNGLVNDEDEKAELQRDTKSNCGWNQHNDSAMGSKIDELIENYLTPTIKQLNKKRKVKRKNKNETDIMNHYNHNIVTNGAEPGQIIDDMSHYSEKLGSCFRKFITSLFCGCGMFQSIGIMLLLFTFGMVFLFYRANELTLILKEMNHWKELSVKRVEYELSSHQKLAQINFDLDVDIDKLKQEHQHRETMEIIEAKTSLTKEFIDKNTRTVTTTYWNFLTTETETVSQTIFSEEDIAFFQNNVLYYGFNEAKKAIEYPQRDKEKPQIDDTDVDDDDDANQHECKSPSSLCHDSFDSI